MFGRNGGPPEGAAPGRVPTKAELESRLPPLRKFIVTLRQVEKVEVLAHEISLGYSVAFSRMIVIGDGQIREQIVAAFGGCEFRVDEDLELPFNPARSTLRIQ